MHFFSLKNPIYLQAVKRFTLGALKDDVGRGDITTNLLFPKDFSARAKIIAKESGVLAGLEEAIWLLKKFGIKARAKRKDGQRVERGETIVFLSGSFKKILVLERTVLNLLQRLSGIATATHRLGPKAAATRKTAWGFLDKKAVMLGGGMVHRLGLWDKVLIKDNHLRKISIQQALTKIKRFKEVEVKTKKEWQEAIKYKPDIIMLDNFKLQEIRELLKSLKVKKFKIEISGGITEKNFKRYAALADIVSLGSLTHSVKALDMSLEIL